MNQQARSRLLPFLGSACAVGVSSIYYNQPLLEQMGKTFHAPSGHSGYVAVATQVGYSIGLFLFVPLGDVLERRSLMVRLYAAVSVALLITAVSPSLPWLMAGSFLVGIFASVTHVALPLAPDLASDDQRGRAIGVVMTGLLLGVLLARTFAGWVSHIPIHGIAGWRTVFLTAAVINAAFVPLMLRMMPKLPPKQKLTRAEAMRSLWGLWRSQPLLREACITGAFIFGSFSCFWTTLAFFLESRYGLGAGTAGSFGLIGAAGVLIAPVAGRMADRRGPRFVLSLALLSLAASYVVLWVHEFFPLPTALHMVALVVGVIILDMGAQMSQIANQVRIFGLIPSARGRLNTVYMTVYFTGAAIGSAIATFAWVHWKWNGVCGLALLQISLAGLNHALGKKDSGAGPHEHIPAEEALLEA